MKALLSQPWSDYELLDCGNGKKLERFGKTIIIRPEILANGACTLLESKWYALAHLEFVETDAKTGSWNALKTCEAKWDISYPALELRFNLSTTKFKHIGIFPEQSVNWNYINQAVRKTSKVISVPKVLNLFAYTGSASLAAKAAGADVYHVESIKQVISWAKSNMELSGLGNIRWVLEDARKFVSRELKRGNKYQGIVMDPPAYGKGPKGETWALNDHLEPLLKDALKLLDENAYFFILNTYTAGINISMLEKVCDVPGMKLESRPLGIESTRGNHLILGHVTRFNNLFND